jgi:hypothetical protein
MFGKTRLHLAGNAAVANIVLDIRAVAEVLLNIKSTARFHNQNRKKSHTANINLHGPSCTYTNFHYNGT